MAPTVCIVNCLYIIVYLYFSNLVIIIKSIDSCLRIKISTKCKNNKIKILHTVVSVKNIFNMFTSLNQLFIGPKINNL